MRTVTHTDQARVRVEERDGRSVVLVARRGARIAPRVLGGAGPAARVALVALQAGPLGGDADRVRLEVGPGAALVLVPVAATVVLAGAAAIAMDATLGAGATLVLDEPATILTVRASLHRRFTAFLGPGARLALREALVLGRSGEAAGAVDSLVRVEDERGPLLHDALCLTAARRPDHVALAPGDRVLGTAALLGVELSDPPAGVMQLARGGFLARAAGPALHEVESALQPAWDAACREVRRPRLPAPAA